MMGIFSKRINNKGAVAGMLCGSDRDAGLHLPAQGLVLHPGHQLVQRTTDPLFLSIKSTSFGAVGALINFVVAYVVSNATEEPPVEIQELVEVDPHPERRRGAATSRSLSRAHDNGAPPATGARRLLGRQGDQVNDDDPDVSVQAPFCNRSIPTTVCRRTSWRGSPVPSAAEHLAAGAEIYAFGEPLDGLFLIESGRVEILDRNGALVSLLGPRNSFGERGLMRDGPGRDRGADDRGQPVLLMLPVAEFRHLVATSPPSSASSTAAAAPRRGPSI